MKTHKRLLPRLAAAALCLALMISSSAAPFISRWSPVLIFSGTACTPGASEGSTSSIGSCSCHWVMEVTSFRFASAAILVLESVAKM